MRVETRSVDNKMIIFRVFGRPSRRRLGSTDHTCARVERAEITSNLVYLYSTTLLIDKIEKWNLFILVQLAFIQATRGHGWPKASHDHGSAEGRPGVAV